MKKIRNFATKVLIIFTIIKDVFYNLWGVIKNISKQDLDELEAKKKEHDELVAKQIEEEIDDMNIIEEEVPSHKLVGTDNGLPPRRMTPEEADPKNFTTEVSEQSIINAHKQTGGINSFTRLLYTAEIFREAGMTPMYLTNKNETIIRVAAEETWMKPNALN